MPPEPSLNTWFPAASAGTAAPKSLRAIGIIGSGAVATGIAHRCATKGLGVMLHDARGETLTEGVEVIRGLFKAAEGRGEITGAAAHRAMGGISITTGLDDLEFCDLIIETLPEAMAAKQARLEKLAKVMPKEVLLASATTAAGLGELNAVTPAPERLLGLVFADPIEENSLVEVIIGPATSRETAESILTFLATMGLQVSLQGSARPVG